MNDNNLMEHSDNKINLLVLEEQMIKYYKFNFKSYKTLIIIKSMIGFIDMPIVEQLIIINSRVKISHWGLQKIKLLEINNSSICRFG